MMTRVSAPLPDPVVVDLPVAGPFAADRLLAFLSRESVPGVEYVREREYARSLRLGSGDDAEVGTIRLHLPGPGDPPTVRAVVRFAARIDEAVARCRHLLDLDTDGSAVDRRVVGHGDGYVASGLLAPFVCRWVDHPSRSSAAGSRA